MSNDKQLERWKRVRSKGPVFFIGVYGFVWGVLMMAVMCLFQFIISRLSPGRDIEDFFLPVNLGIYFGIFIVVGLGWATVNWFVNERRFAKAKGDAATEE